MRMAPLLCNRKHSVHMIGEKSMLEIQSGLLLQVIYQENMGEICFESEEIVKRPEPLNVYVEGFGLCVQTVLMN